MEREREKLIDEIGELNYKLGIADKALREIKNFAGESVANIKSIASSALFALSLLPQEEFDKLDSGINQGEKRYPCPKCGGYNTEPTPGCPCRGKFGHHVMKFHHTCKIPVNDIPF